MWTEFLYIAGMGLAAWLIFRMVKSNPAWFSKQNISRSFYVMGLLALGLIGFIVIVIFLLRH